MELPEIFRSSMKSLLGDDYDAFISSYEDKPKSALRINTSKITVDEFDKIAPFETKVIPYADNGRYINDTDAWSKHPYYYAGLYYIQEPSAMLPACTLDVDKDDAVLDLCASPGGKSTALAAKHPKVLMSNDISPSRAIPLVYNMEHTGTFSHAVTAEDPKKLEKYYAGCFDKIIVDAPCSGEGMFRKDSGLIRAYLEKGPEQYSPIQRSILESAYNMLRSGGVMLYSTCTFSDIEDEQVVIDLVGEHKDLTVLDIEKKNGLTGIYDKYKDDEKIIGCVHALPHLFRGEGHFMALMKKDGDAPGQRFMGRSSDKLIPFDELPQSVRGFTDILSSRFSDIMKDCRYIIRAGAVYMLPESVFDLVNSEIRFMRTGLWIGKINKAGKFVPSTPFALALKMSDHKNVLNLRADDPNVIKYLKGETLIANDPNGKGVRKGNVLVCVDGFTLGFASYDGCRFKNLYEKSWTYG